MLMSKEFHIFILDGKQDFKTLLCGRLSLLSYRYFLTGIDWSDLVLRGSNQKYRLEPYRPVVYSTDRSKVVIPVLVLLFVA